MKKYIFFFLLSAAVWALSGCNTLKGAASGFGQDWKGLEKADQWLQQNAW